MESSDQTYQGQCDKHGDFVGKMIVIPLTGKVFKMSCPVCYEEHENEEAEKIRLDDQMRRERHREALRLQAGVPKRFAEKTLETFEAKTDGQIKALNACKKLVEGVREGSSANLILSGKPGTGKTHLSCGIVNELFENHKVRRIDWPDLIRKIRATWARDSDLTEEQVLDFYGSLELLILEEVGTGTGSDDEKARVFQVINRRYEAMLPTVIVTNLSVRELSDELGERVIDRLREGDRALLVFDWDSYRS